MNNNYTTFINVSLSLPSLSHTPEHVSGAERWEFPLPAHVGVRSPAPPLKVGPDGSAQFRSPLIYNFIPLQRNRSTLAQILDYSACLRPAVFNRSLTPPTHCLRGRRGAGLLRDCCGKNPLHFYSVTTVAAWLDHTWYARIPQAMWLL